MSPVLKYHDGTDWVEVSTAGPQGPAGPSGPTGPTGVGSEEVAIAAAAPADPALELWVDTSVPDPTLSISLDELTDVDTTTTPPAVGDALVWNGTEWEPGEVSGGVDGLPLGSILPYPSATPPADWLLCDGSAIPAQYTNLIALIGANTPDLRGKFVAGAGGAYAVGDTGGADTVTLTEAEMPAHSHYSTPDGTHQALYTQNNGVPTWGFTASDLGPPTTTYGSISGSTTTMTGGDLAHENRPPFYALAYIIKATLSDIVATPNLYLPLSGGTLAGALTLAADPVAPLEAATMQYVDTYQTTGLVTPAAGWDEYGGNAAGLFVTKYAGMVTLEAAFKRTGPDIDTSLGTAVLIGTVPVGFRPVHDVMGSIDNSAMAAGVCSVGSSDGSLYYILYPAATIATNGYIFCTVTYRQGS